MAVKDQGFTLIELLVVMNIIGILTAIAIPVFVNQRKRAVDASLKSDLHNAATQVETWATDNPWSAIITDTATAGPPAVAAAWSLSGVMVSPGNTITLTPSAATIGAYCIFAHSSGASAATGTGTELAYFSAAGGLQTSPATTTTCS
jgi:type IV pilus assembly protein PilA